MDQCDYPSDPGRQTSNCRRDRRDAWGDADRRLSRCRAHKLRQSGDTLDGAAGGRSTACLSAWRAPAGELIPRADRGVGVLDQPPALRVWWVELPGDLGERVRQAVQGALETVVQVLRVGTVEGGGAGMACALHGVVQLVRVLDGQHRAQ